MVSQEDEDLGSGSASNPGFYLDWAKFDQSIQDVLSICSGAGGTKRNRIDDAGQNLAPAPPAKRKKTARSAGGQTDGEEEDAKDGKEEDVEDGKEEDVKDGKEEDVKDGKEEGGQKENPQNVEMSQDLLFKCAACGLEAEDYKEVEEHVQTDHQVGDDQELVVASILVPDTQEALKTFQCGVQACGRQFVGLQEADLKKHLGDVHGDDYIENRNILRICRVCSGKFSSDEELSHHIQVWHSRKLFANGEEKKMEVALSLPPLCLARVLSLRTSTGK